MQAKVYRTPGTLSICETCGNQFVVKKATYGRFCSVKCGNAKLRPRTKFPRPYITPEDRFWSKVEKTDTCWLWRGAIFQRSGYGRFSRPGIPHILVHRYSYELHYGNIPTGMNICHSCDVRNCVRPDHLWVGSARDNMLDMVAKGRQNKRLHEHPELAARGQANGNSKLTEQQVREIRQRVASGEQRKILAAEYNVSKGLVDHIVRRTIWRHVE